MSKKTKARMPQHTEPLPPFPAANDYSVALGFIAERVETDFSNLAMFQAYKARLLLAKDKMSHNVANNGSVELAERYLLEGVVAVRRMGISVDDLLSPLRTQKSNHPALALLTKVCA